MFIPVRPYLQRILTIEAYAPRDPIKGTNNNDVVRQAVRENIARDINKSKARDAEGLEFKASLQESRHHERGHWIVRVRQE